MCGISFYCSRQGALADELNESLRVTAHRGPDASGVVNQKIGQYALGIGHNRLSIMDLSDSGSQPMRSQSSNLISYNGEIYNHLPLRQELERLGHEFIGSSDTEVILRLYDEFGTQAFSRLKGMFALVILDPVKELMFVVRDTVGIKPIYLFQQDGALYGSSEIRGLKAFSAVNTELDENDIYEFFNNGFLYEPATGFKHIKKLMPGHLGELNLATGAFSVSCYSRIADFHQKEPLSDKMAAAIKNQQIADVPLGVFFSGGADSSILAGHTNDSALFFAQYAADPAADIDSKYSREIADYLDKPLIVTRLDDDEQDVDSLLASVDFVATNTEELMSDYTFWAAYQLSMAARDNGFKVMLSGMGGDEAFAGYPRYLVLKHHALVKRLSPVFKGLLKLGLFPKSLNKKFERLVSYSEEKHWGVGYSRMLGFFSRAELTSLFGQDQQLHANFHDKVQSIVSAYAGDKKDKVKLAQFMDNSGFLAHNLMVSDKASMLASIELRVPFLDESIVAHGLAESSRKLIRGRQTKFPLKELLKEILPNKLVERPKTGFNPPLDGLINTIGAERLNKELSTLHQWLKPSAVNGLIDDHFAKVANNTYKLWQLLYFSRWIKAWS